MNFADIVIVLIIIALVAAAIIYEVKRRKKSKSCGSGCGGCPYAGTCAEKRDNEKDDAR